MKHPSFAYVFGVALSLMAGGCGGEGTTAPSPSPAAAPAPSPAPAPAPPPSPISGTDGFGIFGQTASQTFATLGFSFAANPGQMDDIPVRGTENAAAKVGLRLDAPNSLLLSIEGVGEGQLAASGATNYMNGQLTGKGYSALGASGWLHRPSMSDGTHLAFSMYGFWTRLFNTGTAPIQTFLFIYGLPTSSSGVPASGTAQYKADEGSPVLYYGPKVSDLTVDFAAGTVNGTVEIATQPVPRSYALQDVRLSVDRTAFEGKLVSGNAAIDGTISGRFTGPAGQEMIARYVVPSGSDMPDFVLGVGIWGARRQ